MWTGDMQSGYPTQWALNPSAYQNVSNEEVDWASLAQQWIKMKETFPAEQVPPAPPPPPIKPEDSNDIEGGEAPMDMSKDDAEPQPPPSNSVTQDGGSWGNWNNWQQWGWGWGGSGPVNATPMMPSVAGGAAASTTTAATSVTTSNKATVPAAGAAATGNTAVPPYNYAAPPNVSHNFTGDANSTFEYNHGGPMPEHFNQQGYWTGGPAPFIRGNKGVSEDWRDTRGHGRHAVKPEEEEVDTTTVIDAAKRKQLPAWIREGLEKMEREKQRKLDKERQMKEREEELSKKRQEEEDALHNFDAGVIVKSKFDTDSEESEKEEEVVQVKGRKSRFHDGPIVQNVKLPSPPPPPVQRKSKEQIMQEVMVKVRHVLTEILMSVTNEEMRVILEEELANARAKAPAMHLRNTPALTSLTGKLGLGIYDTDSEASSGESDREESGHENTIDSDQELRERVQRRKQEFARVAHEIENRIQEQEERERRLMIEDEQENEEETGHETEPQVDTSHNNPGVKMEAEKMEDICKSDVKLNVIYSERELIDHYTSDSIHKESSYEQSDESDDDSSDDSSYSSSRSSSDSHYRKSHKSSKQHKDKKNRSKGKTKRSRSRGSDRRKSSHRKSSRESRRDDRRRRSRSKSRDRRSRSRERHYSDNHRYRRSSSRHRHSSESYSSARKRRRYSRSSSSDAPRGKKSSHRSRD